MEGKTARGASSPANPALHIPDPLSTTNAATSSSMVNICFQKVNKRKTRNISIQAKIESATISIIHKKEAFFD